jgi:hypothetical protein
LLSAFSRHKRSRDRGVTFPTPYSPTPLFAQLAQQPRPRQVPFPLDLLHRTYSPPRTGNHRKNILPAVKELAAE